MAPARAARASAAGSGAFAAGSSGCAGSPGCGAGSGRAGGWARARPGRLLLALGGRDRVVAAEGLLGGAGGQPGEHDPAVLADQHGAGGDVAVDPAVGVQHPKRGEHVGGDLGGAVRRQRPLGEQGGERPGGHGLADDPERAVLGEDVEDLVEPGVVGDAGGGLGGLHGAADGRVGGAAGGAGAGRRGLRVVVRTGLPVEDLGLDHLGQQHLADQDLLAAVGVEGGGLGQLEGARRGKRQAVPVGEDPSRVLVHPVPLPRRPNPFAHTPVGSTRRRRPSRYVARRAQMRRWAIQGTSAREVPPHFFGRKVSVKVRQVPSRSSPCQSASLAVYIRPYPRLLLTTRPRSIERYFTPPST
ncbi:hypothetical protein CCOS2040_10965 [Streptomyces albidoflavus]|nr:hypothetical protein CCOS2040_10965 [Streptomyces albidoflavus]